MPIFSYMAKWCIVNTFCLIDPTILALIAQIFLIFKQNDHPYLRCIDLTKCSRTFKYRRFAGMAIFSEACTKFYFKFWWFLIVVALNCLHFQQCLLILVLFYVFGLPTKLLITITVDSVDPNCFFPCYSNATFFYKY